MTPPPSPPDIGIVSVAIVVAGAVFGPDMAHLLGPYFVILAGAVLGAFINTARRPARTLAVDAATFVCVVLFVLLTTVTASDLAAYYLPLPEGLSRSALGLVAIGIGAIGEDWLRIGHWALGLARGAIELATRNPPRDGGQS